MQWPCERERERGGGGQRDEKDRWEKGSDRESGERGREREGG